MNIPSCVNRFIRPQDIWQFFLVSQNPMTKLLPQWIILRKQLLHFYEVIWMVASIPSKSCELSFSIYADGAQLFVNWCLGFQDISSPTNSFSMVLKYLPRFSQGPIPPYEISKSWMPPFRKIPSIFDRSLSSISSKMLNLSC